MSQIKMFWGKDSKKTEEATNVWLKKSCGTVEILSIQSHMIDVGEIINLVVVVHYRQK